MTFLPIVEREMRAASRRSSTYWSRAQVVVAALVPTAFLLIGPMDLMTPSQRGAQIFQTLAFLAFFFAIFSAVRLTADCISSEKREGTLGFLFLTDLKPYDVVLGKLSATSLTALYGLLSLLPVLAIPVLMGGVTLGDLARLTLVLLNTLFFALSVALFVSTVSWHERKAVGMTMLLLFGFGAGLPMVGGLLASLNGPAELAPWFTQASPGYACGRIESASYGAAPGAFWFSTAVTHVLGWMFFALSCRVLPRVWQDRPAAGQWLRWREWCRRMLMGDAESRRSFRKVLLDVNPIYWLASRERRMIWYPWILLVSVGAIIVFACVTMRVRSVEIWPLLFVSFLMNWFFKHWAINIACSAFSRDRDNGALELLLSTPLRIEDVLAGHRRALNRQFLAPITTMVVVELVLFVMAIAGMADSARVNMDRADQGILSIAMLANIGIFIADYHAGKWVGWWSSVVAKSASSAVTSVYVRLMIGPWFAAGMMIILTYIFSDQMHEVVVGLFALAAWVATSLWADVVFARSARRKLLGELRVVAVERYSGGDAGMIWWRRLGRALGRRWSGAPRGSRPDATL